MDFTLRKESVRDDWLRIRMSKTRGGGGGTGKGRERSVAPHGVNPPKCGERMEGKNGNSAVYLSGKAVGT